MGKRGPAPKPTALRVLHGDKDDRINRREPSTPGRKPVMPAHLTKEAARVWRYYVGDLFARGIVSAFDRDTFAVFCEAVAEHRRAAELLQTSLLVKGSNGEPKKNPAFQIWRDTAAVIRAYAQEFGLTASARSQLVAPDAKQDLEALLYPDGARGAR